MARQINDLYLENSFDRFFVVELIESKKYHEYTVEIYSLRQEVKNSSSVGPSCGYDFLFHGVRFFHYITGHPAILDDKQFIDRMLERSYQDALGLE
jgi:hypothetical protein